MRRWNRYDRRWEWVEDPTPEQAFDNELLNPEPPQPERILKLPPPTDIWEDMFGFTTLIKPVLQARAWLVDATLDKWKAMPLYKGEDLESASTLTRGDWRAIVIAREANYGSNQASVNVWGPDSLAVRPTLVYDWERLVAGLRVCSHCNATDVETTRYSFAGRICLACSVQLGPGSTL